MRRPQIVYDGLWRCLCPAYDRTSLLRAVQAPIIGRSLPRITRQTRQPWTQKRYFEAEHLSGAKAHDTPFTADRKNLYNSYDKILLTPKPPKEEEMDNISTEELMVALRKLRDPRGFTVDNQPIDRHARVVCILDHLVRTRNLPLNAFFYECLMDTMADPQGNARGVRKLLNAMEENGIAITGELCQSALAALAVHPDYALRHQVLNYMKDRWVEKDGFAAENVLLAMLREGQYELAYDTLMEEHVEAGKRVEYWLYDIFIFVFGQQGHLDEVLQLMMHRKHAKGSDIGATSLMYYMLDLCSSAFHYDGTLMAWNSLVRSGTLKPSDGILENVLATAARQGDVDLATEVHSMLSSRKRVDVHHYEGLVEALCESRHVDKALRILCIMADNDIFLTRDHTRVLYNTICQDPSLLSVAEDMIWTTVPERKVPEAAVSAVIEARAKTSGSESAIDLYRELKSLSGHSPDARTIQDMIINSKDPDNIRLFFNDLKGILGALTPPPSRLPIPAQKFIMACLDTQEIDLALRFVLADKDLMLESKEAVPAWLKKLTEQAVQAEDGRIWTVFDWFMHAGRQEAVMAMQRTSKMMQMARKMKNEGGDVEDFLDRFANKR